MYYGPAREKNRPNSFIGYVALMFYHVSAPFAR